MFVARVHADPDRRGRRSRRGCRSDCGRAAHRRSPTASTSSRDRRRRIGERGGDRHATSATRWAAGSACSSRSTAPSSSSGLVLVSASPGIADAAERAAAPRGRRAARGTRSSVTASTRSSTGGSRNRCSRRSRAKPPGSTTDASGNTVRAPHAPAPRARPGRRSRRTGSDSASSRCRCCSSPARSTRKYVEHRATQMADRDRARRAWRSVAKAGHACSPRATRATSAQLLRQAGRRGVALEQVADRARTARTGSIAVDGHAAAYAVTSHAQQRRRRETARRTGAPAARRRARARRRCRPTSPSSRSTMAGTPAASATRARPARHRAAALEHDHVGRVRARASRRASSSDRTHSSAAMRHVDRAVARGEVVDRRDRLLDELEVERGEPPIIVDARSSTSHAPFASTRTRHARAHARRAPRPTSADVVGTRAPSPSPPGSRGASARIERRARRRARSPATVGPQRSGEPDRRRPLRRRAGTPPGRTGSRRAASTRPSPPGPRAG